MADEKPEGYWEAISAAKNSGFAQGFHEGLHRGFAIGIDSVLKSLKEQASREFAEALEQAKREGIEA